MIKIRFLGLLLVLISLIPSLALAMHWEPYHGGIPQNAFRSGYDTNQKTLYLCRAKIHGSLQPGKTWRAYGKCNIPYAGKEVIARRFSLLRWDNSHPSAHWARQLGKKPLAIGHERGGKRLYLCRANYRGSQQPGKTWRGYGHCNISYAGREIVRDQYQVLTRSKVYVPHHNRSDNKRECVTGAFGNKACGYHCVKRFNKVACASTPKQQCVISDFGKIACGFNCVHTATMAVCAQSKHATCVVSPFGKARCGRNCRLDGFNHISCG